MEHCQCLKLSGIVGLKVISILHLPKTSSSHGCKVAIATANASTIAFLSQNCFDCKNIKEFNGV
jgi:hypothetical protein